MEEGNPQLENGFTRIANEILEAILRFDFTETDFRVVLLLIRRTYGYQRKEARMSSRLVAKMTHRSQPQVVKAIQRLVSRRVLVPVEGTVLPGRGNVYRLNKYHLNWVGDNKKQSVLLGDNKKQSENCQKIITSDNEKLSDIAGKPRQEPNSRRLKKIIKKNSKEKECGPPKGPPHGEKKSIYTTFKDQAYCAWERTYGRPPAWGKAEWKCLHQGFLRLKDADEAIGRWNIFLQDETPYYLGHNPKKFLGEIDRWISDSTRKEKKNGKQSGGGRQKATAGQLKALEGIGTKIQI